MIPLLGTQSKYLRKPWQTNTSPFFAYSLPLPVNLLEGNRKKLINLGIIAITLCQ